MLQIERNNIFKFSILFIMKGREKLSKERKEEKN